MARFKDTKFKGLTKYYGGEKYPHIHYHWLNREQLLMMLDQDDLVAKEILKWCELFDLNMDDSVLAFVDERWDEFFEFIRINTTTDKPTLTEVDLLIPKYLELQERFMEKERLSRTEPSTVLCDHGETMIESNV